MTDYFYHDNETLKTFTGKVFDTNTVAAMKMKLLGSYEIYDLPRGCIVTADYDISRIRVYVNSENKIVSASIG